MANEAIYIYSGSPIDDWTGWELVGFAPLCQYDVPGDLSCIDRFLSRAKHIACGLLDYDNKDRGNEGPYWIPLPKFCGDEFCVAWKQDNDGVTFVASSVRLPWLEKECTRYWNNGSVVSRY